MAYDSVIAFWQKVGTDKALQEKIAPQGGQVPKLHGSVKPDELKELSKIAKDEGFDCSPEELAATEAVIRFWEQVTKDKQLQEKLKPAQSIDAIDRASDEIARVAGEAGYQFTGQQVNTITGLLQNTEYMGERELSAKQLDNVVGGAIGTRATSFDLALSGKLAPTLRTAPRVGPGGVSQYM